MSEYKKVKAQDDHEDLELATVATSSSHGGDAGDDNIPVVKAILCEDEDGKKPAAAAKADAAPRPRVRVVAPCALPPLYHLTVQTDELDDSTMMVNVIVPSPGVHEGQEFEAEVRSQAKNSIKGRFSTDLFSCCDDSLCMTGWFCPGLVFAAVLERLKLDWMANPGPYKSTYATVSAVWFTYLGMYCLGILSDGALGRLEYVPLILLVVIQTRARMAVREKYQIHGDCFTDCCTVYWCGMCAAVQMHRHMRQSGHPPRRPFRKMAEGVIIV